jgi:hypothetical protein
MDVNADVLLQLVLTMQTHPFVVQLTVLFYQINCVVLTN